MINDELRSLIMKEFVVQLTKMYSFLKDDNKEEKRLTLLRNV